MQWLPHINWASSIFLWECLISLTNQKTGKIQTTICKEYRCPKCGEQCLLSLWAPDLVHTITTYHDLCPCGTYGAVETLWVEVIAHSLHPVIPGLDGKVAPLAHGLEHLPPVYKNSKYTEDWKVISMCHTYM